MRVLHVASEVVPWSKTGGLADVAGALPGALTQADESVRAATVTPMYPDVWRAARKRGLTIEDTPLRPKVRLDGHVFRPAIRRGTAPGQAPTYFVEYNDLYQRDGIYDDADHRQWHDNPLRFALLSRVALEIAGPVLGGVPDVVHSHDWQTGLVPYWLRTTYRSRYPKTASVHTIHNLAYQGVCPKEWVNRLGLRWGSFVPRGFEYHDALSFMKAGLSFAHVVTTVSPSYAGEIRTPAHGARLDGYLRDLRAPIVGILNGIDATSWDPATDPALPANFGVDDLEGKAACRAQLLAEAGLKAGDDEPLITVISRFAHQKGLDLVGELAKSLRALGARMIVLGSGDPKTEAQFRDLQRVWGDCFRVVVGYKPTLARQLYAGSDMLLMPSRFEPCGLNQMYAMRYGTVPIVHAVGGLRDTVRDPGDSALMRGEGTGFRFDVPDAYGLWWATERAVRCFREDPEGWRTLRDAVMRHDWSWHRSANTYLSLYRQLAH